MTLPDGRVDLIQLRRDTAADWAVVDPVLAAGEPGWDSTNGVLKIGDGVTAWSALAPAAAGTPPQLVDVNVFPTAIAQTNWNDIAVEAASIGGYLKLSSGAQNDAISFDVIIGAGTWTLEVIHATTNDWGIATITIDGAAPTSFGGSADTIDFYSAVLVSNVRSQITGMVIPTTAVRRLTLTMATKNPASAGFRCGLGAIQLRQTA